MATRAQQNALSKFQERFNKSYGEDILITSETAKPYEILSTGSLSLDYALGVGGIVEGRLVEMWGPEGVGKTTLAMMMVAEAQKKYPAKPAVWVDMEGVWDWDWAVAHGVDIDPSRLFLVEPSSSEDVADQIKDCMASGLFSVVVLDSVGAMITEKEKEKDANEAVVAANAKIVTRMVKLAIVEGRNTGTTPILINQVRSNIGSYGADTTTGGGWALKHASSFKFKLSRTGTPPLKTKINGEEATVGFEIKVRVERNKVAPAYRDGTMVLFNQPSKFGPVGIDIADEATTLGIKTGIIEQGGAWYTLPNGVRLNGKDRVIDHLRENPESIAEVRSRLLDLRHGEVSFDELDLDEAEVMVDLG